MKRLRSMNCPLILSSLSTPLIFWFITDLSWNIIMLLVNIYAVENTRRACISKNQDDLTVTGENSFNLYKTAHKASDISKKFSNDPYFENMLGRDFRPHFQVIYMIHRLRCWIICQFQKKLEFYLHCILSF